MTAPSLRLLAALPVAAIIAAASLTGCQSKTDKAKENLVDQAVDFRTQLNKMPADLDDVRSRLLAATSGQNPKRADDFREYSKSLARLRSDAMALGAEANKAEVDAAKYFLAWAKQTKNTAAADRAASRDTAAVGEAKVQEALGYLKRGRTDFNDLIAALSDVEKRLGANLTEQGVLAVQPDVQVALMKELDVRNYIDRLDDAIDAAVTK
jgi:hypothetical protein